MKITKIITPVILATASITPTVAIATSCNPKKSSSNPEWVSYIYDRTFSLMGTSSAGTTWGTAWILSDVTPNIDTDYKYYIATNWHVQKGIEKVHSAGSNDKYWFGCNTRSTGLDRSSDYVEFTSYEPEDATKFSYDGQTTITTEEYDEEQGEVVSKKGLRGCDIYVAKVDFSKVRTSKASSAAIAKEKLDRLNKLTTAGKPITELANTTTDSKHFESKKMYTGGYPVNTATWHATWEKHDLSTEKVELEYEAGTQKSTTEDWATHWADTSASPLIDCSPQYIGTNVGAKWMTGGASGSMLVGNFGTDSSPVWKICGIYWGGMGNGTVFYPFYSIFNSSWKNYLADYIK